MPINTPTGYLDITNATLRGSKIVTTGFVGIANANPTNHLSVGSNLHINDTHSNVLQISGNINAASVVLGGISIAPTFDLEVVTNTGNTTPYTVEFNNAATAFVTTANATIGDTLTASKLVGDGSGISAIQSSNVTDFASNVSRITNLSSNLSDNSSRITALESGDISISGDKTFTGDIIFESNVHMNSGNVFVANTVNLTVSDPIIELGSNNSGTNDLGIIMTRPNNNSNVAVVFDESVDILRMGYTLNGASDSVVDLDSNALAVSVQGALTAGSNLEVGTANLFVDTTTSRVGIGMSNPSHKLDVAGDINFTGSLLQNGSAFQGSKWSTSGSDIYRSSGNVGIGTTGPIARLDIDGGAENNTTPALSIRGGLYDPSDLYVLNTYNVSTGVGYAAKVIGVNIKNKVETDNTVQIRNNVGGITSAGAIYLGADNVNQGIFGVLGGTGTAGSTLAEYLTVRAGGNVGIGLTGPESKLHIYGSDNPLMLQSQRSPYPKLSYDFSGTNAENFQFYDHHGSGRGFLYGRKYTTGTNPNANAGWHFYGNDNTLALRIDGSANVGIGTASPGHKLDVNGSIRYDTSLVSTSSTQRLWTSGSSVNWIQFHTSGTSTNHILDIQANNGNCLLSSRSSTPLLLNPSNGGNVGIGTASPSYNLDVNGSFGAKNKGWYITGGGGNAVYNGANPNKNYFAYNVNNTFYGSSVTTYNGASSSAWRSNDGVFTYPEAGLYQVTIHMFINATSSGRYGVFRLNDSGGTSQFSQYMYFTPSGYAAGYQRSWTTFVRVESGWQSYMQPEGGSITLYLSNQHTCLLIDKIC